MEKPIPAATKVKKLAQKRNFSFLPVVDMSLMPGFGEENLTTPTVAVGG
jgi:hypothetical protein